MVDIAATEQLLDTASGELEMQWMWADSRLLPLPMMDVLATYNPFRWTDLMSAQNLEAELRATTEKRPVRIQWYTDEESDGAHTDLARPRTVKSERFSSPAEAVVWLCSRSAGVVNGMASSESGADETETAESQLAKLFPHINPGEIKATLKSCGGDIDLAQQRLIGNPPDLRTDAEAWFKHFDLDGNGKLGRAETAHAVLCSVGSKERFDHQVLEDFLDRWWPAFDPDGSGYIEMNEFLLPDGLRDTVLREWDSLHEQESKSNDHDDSMIRHAEKQSPVGMDENEKAAATCNKISSSGQACKEILKETLAKLPAHGVLGLYFAADLAAPLNHATTLLRERYDTYRRNSLAFEILFVSTDASKEGFDNHFPLPWRSVDFSNQTARMQLIEQFDVKSVPAVVLVGKHGSTISSAGLEALSHDVDGSCFPWKGKAGVSSAELSLSGWAKVRRAVRAVRKGKLSVDDEKLADRAHSVPLTEEGYKTLAKFKSNFAMRHFTKRVVSAKCWKVTDEQRLGALMWEHSGVRCSQSLAHLIADLRNASWICKGDASINIPYHDSNGAEADKTASDSVHTNQSLEQIHDQSERQKNTLISKSLGELKRLDAGGDPGGTEFQALGGKSQGQSEEQPAEGQHPEQKHSVPAKGKGKGRGKPPGPAPSSGKSAASMSVAMQPAEEKGSGNPAEVQQKIEGPPVASTKGSKGPGGKGPKGPPCGKGKSPKGKSAAAGPTRPEIQSWVSKEKPPLRWKRLCHGQSALEDSVFISEEAQSPIDEESLVSCFVSVPSMQDTRRKTIGAAAELPGQVKALDNLWETTEKVDASKRRQGMAIIATRWERLADTFFQCLRVLDLQAVAENPDFNMDLFEQLAMQVKSITSLEKSRLAENDADQKYKWDSKIEGFFMKLYALPYCEERLLGLHGHFCVQSELRQLDEKVTRLYCCVRAIFDCRPLKHVLWKLLDIGNHLNAGSEKNGRADGFDVLPLMQTQILKDMPKGPSQTSLLMYLKDCELTLEDREEFAQLAERLDGWKIPEQGDADPADVGEIQNESGRISRELGLLEASLVGAMKRRMLAIADSAKGAQAEAYQDELSALERFDPILRGHRSLVDKIDTDLEALHKEVPLLARYFASTTAPKDFKPGLALGVIAQLAKRLAADAAELKRASASKRRSVRRVTVQ
eukprot:TRINITY_DN12923_c0_g3_i1.p1 TRINITY_DN12923_c0_g3~~TRINITY_DN12923_c0_g3_i1.p1  ORF type:complete len:1171 (+),score=224.98 TRINITY_DN12923_c0_g3_i1:157-3669(+)